MASGTSSRRRLRRLLEQPDFGQALEEIRGLPLERALKQLQAGLSAGDPQVRWRAVSALGQVAGDLSKSNIEAAREFLRRLFWCLNEECGAVPWGVAEALGEILAMSPELAPEYADLLLSYIQPGGPNQLDWEPLMAGAAWGVGRLAEAQPALMAQRGAADYLLPLLEHASPSVRGMAVWALGNLGQGDWVAELQGLVEDDAAIQLWQDRSLRDSTVGQLAHDAPSKAN